MRYNRDQFFDAYREQFGSLTQEQVEGLNQLLPEIEDDKEWEPLVDYVRRQQIAYMMATFLHEAAATWHPIAEYGKGEGHEYGQPDPETGQTYYGRGYVQSTWKDNYDKLTVAWNATYPDQPVDFVNNPDLLLEAHYAYFAGAYGMRTGLYTGVGLSDYIGEDECDYYNARRIVNALDKAETIAGYAESFEGILADSEMSRDIIEDTGSPNP